MTECQNLCTAEECRRLSLELSLLKAELDLLKSDFFNHTQQSIPDAHSLDGEVNISGVYVSGGLQLSVAVTGMTSDTETIFLPYCTEDVCDNLQRDIDNLRDDFNSHKDEEIPSAHDYKPNIQLDVFSSGNDHTIKVLLDGESDEDVLNLPDDDFNIRIDGFYENNGVFLSVAAGGSNDTAFISLPFATSNEVNNIVNNTINNFDFGGGASTAAPEINIQIDGFYENRGVFLSVAAGGSNDTAFIPLPFVTINEFEDHLREPIPEAHDFESNVDLQLFHQDEVLNVAIYIDNIGQDNETVFLNSNNVGEPLDTNIQIDGFYQNRGVFLSVAGGGSNDTTFIPLPFVTVNEFEDHLRQPIPEAHSFESNVDLQLFHQDEVLNVAIYIDNIGQDNETVFLDMNCDEILDKLNDIEEKIEPIEPEIITGSMSIGACKIETENNHLNISTYQDSADDDGNIIKINYTGIGEALEILSDKITIVHSQLCSLIPTPLELPSLTPFSCVNNKVERENLDDYLDDSPLSRFQDLFEAEKESIMNDPSYDPQSNPVPDTIYLGGTNIHWFNAYLLQALYYQLENLMWLECQSIQQAQNDVVAIVASEKFIHLAKDKVLVLHFVTLDNYPTRQTNSSYRAVQIPAPLAEYSWETHFEGLRWTQGNQYAQMKLEGWKTTVSGWFASEEEANGYFDTVLGLTTAVEENRIISKHSSPKVNIPTRLTRPYRAFITEVDETGKAICLNKYQPPLEENA